MNREKKIVQTSIIGIIANLFLVVGKAIVGIIANSVSIISDAVNNLTDALSSIITIVGTKLANKKPDRKHPFGHGRVEYITSVVIAILILFSAFMAIYESILSIINGTEAEYNYVTIIIVSVAIAVKIALGIYYHKVGKKYKSDALRASGVDALWDALLSASTLVGVFFSMWLSINIEGYLGIVIGLFMIKSGVSILRESLSSIIGEKADRETTLEVKKIVTSFPEVKGAYDLIINNYGPNRSIASIHIEIDDNLTAKEIHPLTRKITEQVYMKLGVILTVGIYAKNESSEEILEIKKQIKTIIDSYPSITQTHGFYVDEDLKTISIDIIFDFEEENKEKIIEEIQSKFNELYPEYQLSIILDTDYSE